MCSREAATWRESAAAATWPVAGGVADALAAAVGIADAAVGAVAVAADKAQKHCCSTVRSREQTHAEGGREGD